MFNIWNEKYSKMRPINGISVKQTSEHPSSGSAFIAGPPVFTRTLAVPLPIINSWLYKNATQIKAMMRTYQGLIKPREQWPSCCFVTTEYFTETWTHFPLESGIKDPILLGLRYSNRPKIASAWDILTVADRRTGRPSIGIANTDVYPLY